MALDVVGNLEACDGTATIFVVDDLSRTVVGIGTKGEVDGTFGAYWHRMLKKCRIAFGNLVGDELLLQLVIGWLIKRHHHEAGGVHVEALDNEWTGGLGIMLTNQVLKRGQVVLARDRE